MFELLNATTGKTFKTKSYTEALRIFKKTPISALFRNGCLIALRIERHWLTWNNLLEG